MIVSRKDLRPYFDDEYQLVRIMQKANRMPGVKSFDRMTTRKNDAIASSPHFDLGQWLKAHVLHMKRMRKDYLPTNRALYKKVIAVWVDLKLKEAVCTETSPIV